MAEEPIQRQVESAKQSRSISTAEHEFTNKLLNLRSEALMVREERSRDWSEYINLARNRNHWSKRLPKYKVDAIVNFIVPTIERKTALLTDTKPTIDVKARRSSGLDSTAIVLKNVIDGILLECNFDQKLAELVTISQIVGCSPINTMWDSSLDFGRGDINIVPADPRMVLIDPFIGRSYRVDRGEFCIIDEVISLDKARDIYPNRADEIQPSAEHSVFSQTGDGMKQSLWSKVYKPFRHAAKPSVIPRTLRSEYWIKDRFKKDGKYYFNGAVRRVTVCGGTIVKDGGNPYLDGKFPIDMLDWHFDMDSPYGWGDVELLKSPQKLTNKLLGVVLENAILMSNAIWVGDKDALSKSDWAKLTNEPGSHVRKRTGKELRREAPPAMPEYIIHLARYLQSAIGEISGMVPTMLGMKSGQVSSGVGVEQLQMAAQALVRLKARAIEGLIQRVGQKLIARIFQYYTSDRLIMKLGKQDELEQYQMVRSELFGNKGEVPDAFKDYVFHVVPGSGLAMSKVQKSIVATQLFQLGIIGELELLETMEYPNAPEVAQKARERRELMQQQQQQGGQAGQRSGMNRQIGMSGRI